jgi:hypothetical protein
MTLPELSLYDYKSECKIFQIKRISPRLLRANPRIISNSHEKAANMLHCAPSLAHHAPAVPNHAPWYIGIHCRKSRGCHRDPRGYACNERKCFNNVHPFQESLAYSL